jgi:hypothetical protein
VLEPRGFRATFFDILDDVEAGELLQIAADDTFVIAQLISESANRAEVAGVEAEKMPFNNVSYADKGDSDPSPRERPNSTSVGPLLSIARKRARAGHPRAVKTAYESAMRVLWRSHTGATAGA